MSSKDESKAESKDESVSEGQEFSSGNELPPPPPSSSGWNRFASFVKGKKGLPSNVGSDSSSVNSEDIPPKEEIPPIPSIVGSETQSKEGLHSIVGSDSSSVNSEDISPKEEIPPTVGSNIPNSSLLVGSSSINEESQSNEQFPICDVPGSLDKIPNKQLLSITFSLATDTEFDIKIGGYTGATKKEEKLNPILCTIQDLNGKNPPETISLTNKGCIEKKLPMALAKHLKELNELLIDKYDNFQTEAVFNEIKKNQIEFKGQNSSSAITATNLASLGSLSNMTKAGISPEHERAWVEHLAADLANEGGEEVKVEGEGGNEGGKEVKEEGEGGNEGGEEVISPGPNMIDTTLANARDIGENAAKAVQKAAALVTGKVEDPALQGKRKENIQKNVINTLLTPFKKSTGEFDESYLIKKGNVAELKRISKQNDINYDTLEQFLDTKPEVYPLHKLPYDYNKRDQIFMTNNGIVTNGYVIFSYNDINGNAVKANPAGEFFMWKLTKPEDYNKAVDVLEGRQKDSGYINEEYIEGKKPFTGGNRKTISKKIKRKRATRRSRK